MFLFFPYNNYYGTTPDAAVIQRKNNLEVIISVAAKNPHTHLFTALLAAQLIQHRGDSKAAFYYTTTAAATISTALLLLFALSERERAAAAGGSRTGFWFWESADGNNNLWMDVQAVV